MRYHVLALPLLWLLDASPAAGAVLTLSCHAVIAGSPVDKIVYVDTQASTVNGIAAAVSDAEVVWTENHPEDSYFYRVNRYTGGLYVAITKKGQTKPSDSIIGECALAAQKKF